VLGASAAVAAQAKVNLFLHVLAQETSGYHQLESLFCRLTLADDVVVRLRSGWTLECHGADMGPAEANLAYRAARLYQIERNWPPGCGIEIVKRIPIGGGLGGGSADAGAVLRCLRALDPNPPPMSAMLAWAGRLGADVPVLTVEAALALGVGRGDRLFELPPLPPRPVMLCVPTERVATREAYEWLAQSRRDANIASAAAPPRMVGLAQLARWASVRPLMSNDFQPVVARHHPDIAAIVGEMAQLPGAQATVMSGSGSTVFTVFDGPIPDPWPLAARPGAAFVATATADHVVGVHRIE
jgi:4-diphosphocytidyl-2-C-methyl-D-erythritol kinase